MITNLFEISAESLQRIDFIEILNRIRHRRLVVMIPANGGGEVKHKIKTYLPNVQMELVTLRLVDNKLKLLIPHRI
jgi:hypothetical protein